MKNDGQGFLWKQAAQCRILAIPAASIGLAIFSAMFFAAGAGSIEIPPAVEKKTVLLKQDYQDAGRVFSARCGQCHQVPDPEIGRAHV